MTLFLNNWGPDLLFCYLGLFFWQNNLIFFHYFPSVVQFLAPVDKTLLGTTRQNVKKLSGHTCVQRVCECHLTLIFDETGVFGFGFYFPTTVQLLKDLGAQRPLCLIPRDTQNVARLLVGDIGNVREINSREPDLSFSVKFTIFMSIFQNYAACHIGNEILVIFHISYHTVEILLRKRKDFCSLIHDRLISHEHFID